jgi:hypothetical protein
MAERAAVVVMMPCVAVVPVPVVCPTCVSVPPSRPVAPVPGTVPCIPCVAPEPVIYDRTVNIYRFDDVFRTVNVFIANYLNAYLVLLVFLHVDRRYVLIDIFRQNGLQNDQSLVAFACLYYAQIIHLTVSVQVEVAECAVRVVEHRLELFQVLSLCKKLSYNLQVQALGDVRTVGGNGYRLFRPCRHA